MPQSIIQKIEISGLFGRFNHTIPQSGYLTSPSILYGDNGVGKSTILNMVFHLLSAAGDKGHRSALRNIPFKKMSVSLSNGVTLTAEKDEDWDDDGNLILQIQIDDLIVAEWEQTGLGGSHRIDIDEFMERLELDTPATLRMSPDVLTKLIQSRNVSAGPDRVKRGQREYLSHLRDVAPVMFYLNADRKLDSDSVSDPSDDLELRRIINRREMKRATDILQASRSISLQQALSNASLWVNKRAVKSANIGSENVHTVYEKVVEHLANNYQPQGNEVPREEIQSLVHDLDKIEIDTTDFAQYEITSKLSMSTFRKSLNTGNPSIDAMSARLIKPYLESLTSRLDAIRPIYNVLNEFITTTNDFLTRKTIKYGLSQGFTILDDLGDKLETSKLSSGEQQLLLIFSYVLAARDTPSVFIIDEPEISLNVKWQRRMVSSLMSIASGSEVQFILASHSIELITQHMDAVVEISAQ